ncbi:MAG: superoxide dismutase [Ignavibacteria bacterium]|nr:superoxide dismutase [Ignavibacteria bacterium]
MKILAIEREIGSPDWTSLTPVLAEEARKVYSLMREGVLREIYFTEHRQAILILECFNAAQAYGVIQQLPLVKGKYIDFTILELHPFTGFDRILQS